jgi:hypothetical protein
MIRILATLSLIAVTACSSQIGHGDLLSDDTEFVFGAAVNANIEAQTVNPEGATGDVEASGARVGKAIGRYETDTVEKPKAPGTLSINTEGEGGGD